MVLDVVVCPGKQHPAVYRWKTLLDYIVARIIPCRPNKLLDTGALLVG
jgi:hypothetical protein